MIYSEPEELVRRLLSYELLMARTSSGTTVRRLLIYGLLLARTSSDKNIKRPRSATNLTIEWRFWCRDRECAEMGKFTVGTGRQAPVPVGFVRFRSDVR